MTMYTGAPKRVTLRPEDVYRPEAPKREDGFLHFDGAAEEASLRTLASKEAEAIRRGEEPGAHTGATARLSRWYAVRQHEALAIESGRAALGYADDSDLRAELVTWLARAGRFAEAAAVLAPLATIALSATLRSDTVKRQGTLLLRAGEFEAARVLLADAAKLAPDDPLSLELSGALHYVDPPVATRDEAAAWFEAAGRLRQGRGEATAALLDFQRALFLAPRTPSALVSLAQVAASGYGGAEVADELLREAASLSEKDEAAKWQQERFERAGRVRETRLALAAALDADLDRDVEDKRFDGALFDARLVEWLAARFEIRARLGRTKTEQARAYDALVEMAFGTLSSPARAVDAALAAFDSGAWPVADLHGFLQRAPEVTELVCDGLVGLAKRAAGANRLDAARTLLTIASRTGEASLAWWAADRIVELASGDRAAEAAAAQWEAEARREKHVFDQSADASEDLGVRELLARLEGLRAFPEEDAVRAELAVALVAELAKGGFVPLAVWDACGSVAKRFATPDERAQFYARLDAAQSQSALLHRRVLALLEGDREGEAVTVARAQIERADEATLALVATLARRERDDVLFGQVVPRMAAECDARIRAQMAVAAASPLEAQDPAAARALLSLARDLDSSALRVLVMTAALEPTALHASQWDRIDDALYSTEERLARRLTHASGAAALVKKRHVDLAPGSAPALTSFVASLVTGTAQEFGETLGWLASLPVAATALCEAIRPVVETLLAREPAATGAILRRVLGAVGLPNASCTEWFFGLARGADSLAVLLPLVDLANVIAPSGARSRAERLYEACRASGDTENQVRLLVDRLRAGDHVPKEDVRSLWVESVRDGSPLSKDAVLRLAEARTFIETEAPSKARAFRQFGFATWELAGDERRAIAAWLQAASITPVRGYALFRQDVVKALGATWALSALQSEAKNADEKSTLAALEREAARLAVETGKYEVAFAHAERALSLDAEKVDALETAEVAAEGGGDFTRLSELYDQLAGKARGRFGRRAAHFRGARFFGKREKNDLAFKHATQAFLSVPSEGGSLKLLTESAERSGDTVNMVRAIEQVAQAQTSASQRAAWLIKGASLISPTAGAAGALLRADMLLSSVGAAPSPGSVETLTEAARDLCAQSPAEIETFTTRVTRAWEGLKKKIEGPEGARVAIGFTKLFALLAPNAPHAWIALTSALEQDGDIEEYNQLWDMAPSFARSPTGAEAALAIAERPYSNVGTDALTLLAKIAEASGDQELIVRARVALAMKDREPPSIAGALMSMPSDDRRRDALVAKVGKQAVARAIDERVHDVFAESPRFARALFEKTKDLLDDTLRAKAAALLVGVAPSVAPLPAASPSLAGMGPAAAKSAPEPPSSAPLSAAEVRAAEEAEEASGWDADASVGEHAVVLDSARLGVARPEEERMPSAEFRAVRQEVEENVEEIENALASAGDFESLARFMDRRAALHEARGEAGAEFARALRLRRVIVLEHRLGRIDLARQEIEKVVAAWPDHQPTLRYLLDLAERGHDSKRAMQVAETLREKEPDSPELRLRLARALYEEGKYKRAEQVLNEVDSSNRTVDEGMLLARLAQVQGHTAEYSEHLDRLSKHPPPPGPDPRPALFADASRQAMRDGDLRAALIRAEQAAECEEIPGVLTLYYLGLKYKLTGFPSRSEALRAVKLLDPMGPDLSGDDQVLRTFLLAEAVDLAHSAEDGAKLLVACEQERGQQPLLALGLAERYARLGLLRDAMAKYDVAISGSLFGLRREGEVALAASDVARGLGRDTDARRYLQRAAEDPALRTRATRKLAELIMVTGESLEARTLLLGVVDTLSGDERARTLRQIAHSYATGEAESERERASFLRAAVVAAESAMLVKELERELNVLRESMVPPPPAGEETAPLILDLHDQDVASAKTLSQRSSARIRVAKSYAPEDVDKSEASLRSAMNEGSLEATGLLGDLLERKNAVPKDVIAVRLRAAELAPGSRPHLEALLRAAKSDKNVRLVAALDHVLSCFGPRHIARLPPPLFLQDKNPVVLQLLQGQSEQRYLTALRLVWEDARTSFRKRHSRPPSGRARPLPSRFLELVESTLTLLDAPRVNVELLSGQGAPTFDLRLDDLPLTRETTTTRRSPAHGAVTIMFDGDVQHDTPELRHVLGCALSAGLPRNVLALGLPTSELEALCEALAVAFGKRKPEDRAQIADITAQLWDLMSAPNQRALPDLLGEVAIPRSETLVEEAKQAGRRTGLFVCGDFGTAARLTVREFGLVDVELETAHGLESIAREVPAVADLYRLAISPAFADARWNASHGLSSAETT